MTAFVTYEKHPILVEPRARRRRHRPIFGEHLHWNKRVQMHQSPPRMIAQHSGPAPAAAVPCIARADPLRRTSWSASAGIAASCIFRRHRSMSRASPGSSASPRAPQCPWSPTAGEAAAARMSSYRGRIELENVRPDQCTYRERPAGSASRRRSPHTPERLVRKQSSPAQAAAHRSQRDIHSVSTQSWHTLPPRQEHGTTTWLACGLAKLCPWRPARTYA